MDPEVLDCLPKIWSVLRIKLFFFCLFFLNTGRDKKYTQL